MKSNCSIHINNDGISCFTLKSLLKISKSYNKYNKNKIIIKSNKKYLINEIEKKLKGRCKTHWCWLDQNFVKDLNDYNIENFTFLPKKPKGKYTWLSNIDISNVLKQYQKKYPEFISLGPVPIDFKQIYTELTNLKIENLLKKNISKIGIIYNLDKHNEPGSHWVASFININEPSVEFFDSVGDYPEKEIIDFLEEMRNNIINIKKKPFKIKINRIQHQYADSECGVYCLHFIIQRIYGKSFEYIIQNVIKDEKMNSNRTTFFRPHH